MLVRYTHTYIYIYRSTCQHVGIGMQVKNSIPSNASEMWLKIELSTEVPLWAAFTNDTSVTEGRSFLRRRFCVDGRSSAKT